MNSIARLTIYDLADGGKRFIIDCMCSRTHADAPPESLARLGDDAITRITLFRHWLDCQHCDWSALRAKLWDVPISKDEFENTLAVLAQAAADGRKN